MANSGRNPTTWDEYEGRASVSNNSLASTDIGEDTALLDDGDDDLHGGGSSDRRRSSVTNRLAAVADIGGVNSFRSFARSWQRAAGFPEIIPRQPSFVYEYQDNAAVDQETEDILYGRSHVDHRSSQPTTSLLRQHLEASLPDAHHGHFANGAGASTGEPSNGVGNGGDDAAAAAGENLMERESKALDAELANDSSIPGFTPSSRSSIFGNPPHLATPSIIGSYESYRGSGYGTIGGGSLRPRRLSIVPATGRWEEEEEDAAHGEHEPILVKEVKQGNKVVLTVEGQSTLPQSVFNSINAIIGVGILSLPLAFKMTGWVIGFIILTLTATVTGYTGKLLARCMDVDPSLITYSDLAYISFGTRARVIVSALFSLELIAACVALAILFADSLDLLFPGVASVNSWKCVCAVLVLLLNLLPMRFLSYTSVIGIFSTFCIVCIVIIDGLLKEHTPGSLREPAKTYLFPSNWLALPLAYGLMASPWGAHSIFPSIYRDMRHPQKWGKAVKVTFSFSYVLDTCLAVVGILMFGNGISDAITSNVLKTKGYPEAMTILMCIFVAIIPLTKIPLNARPLITTADVIFGVHEPHTPNGTNAPASRRAQFVRSGIRGLIRVVVVFILLVISIAFPAFDSVCAFLGAALCTLISIILPISFYLKLYWKDIPRREKGYLFFLLVLFSIFGLLGTIWSFLPKDLIGA